jgi:hypothetical protein
MVPDTLMVTLAKVTIISTAISKYEKTRMFLMLKNEIVGHFLRSPTRYHLLIQIFSPGNKDKAVLKPLKKADHMLRRSAFTSVF